MKPIELTKSQQQIVDYLHVDFRAIDNLEKIHEAVSIWGSIDWYWSYSDQGSTLRHGEERVKTSLARIAEIADETQNADIQALCHIHHPTNPQGLAEHIDLRWPWYPAYAYMQRKVKDLAITLHLAGVLDDVNSIITTIEGILTQMVRTDMSEVYNDTILDNAQVAEISAQAGILPNRLYTNAMYLKGVSVSQRVYAQSSAVALFGVDLWKILVDSHSLDEHTPRVVALTTPSDGREFALSFRTCHLHSNYYMLMLYVHKSDLAFAIPLKVVELKKKG